MTKTTWDENPFAWMWQWVSQPGMMVSAWLTLAILSWVYGRYEIFGWTMFCIGVQMEKWAGEKAK